MEARQCECAGNSPRQTAFELFWGHLSEDEQSASRTSSPSELQERFCDIIAAAAFELFGEQISEAADFGLSQAVFEESVLDNFDKKTSDEPCERTAAFEALADPIDDKAWNVHPDVNRQEVDSCVRKPQETERHGNSDVKKPLITAKSSSNLSSLMVGSPSACLRLRRRSKTSFGSCADVTLDDAKASQASATKSCSSRLAPLKLARSCSLGALRSGGTDKATGAGLLPKLRAKMLNAAIDWSLGSSAGADLVRTACGGEAAFMRHTIC